MWNITGTRIHMNTRGSEPWASGSLIPGSNYSAQVSLVSERMQCECAVNAVSCLSLLCAECRGR